MPVTPNLQVIQESNQLVAKLQAIQAALASLANLVKQNAAVPIGNSWNNMSTAALAADGQLGAADPSTVQTDPIDTRVYSTLQYALTPQQYAQLLTAAQAFIAVSAGQAVAANGATAGVLAAIAIIT